MKKEAWTYENSSIPTDWTFANGVTCGDVNPATHWCHPHSNLSAPEEYFTFPRKFIYNQSARGVTHLSHPREGRYCCHGNKLVFFNFPVAGFWFLRALSELRPAISMVRYGGMDRGQRSVDGCDGVRVTGFGGHALFLLHLLWLQHLGGSSCKSFNFCLLFWIVVYCTSKLDIWGNTIPAVYVWLSFGLDFGLSFGLTYICWSGLRLNQYPIQP